MGLKEMGEQRKREKAEEEEFRRRRTAGEVPMEELSPREQREQTRAYEKTREVAGREAEKARREARRSAPRVAREAVRASEEARAAEERAKVLETELYGAPYQGQKFAVTRDPQGRETSRRKLPEEGYALRPEEKIEYGPPMEVTRDRWGREIGRAPLRATRREEAARLEKGTRELTGRVMRLQLEKLEEAEEESKRVKRARRTGKVLGPAREAAGLGVRAVEEIGRGLTGFGVQTGPYQMQPPSVIPRPPRPQGPPVPEGQDLPRPRAPDLSHLRDLQRQGPRTGKSGSKGKNHYQEQMRRMRKFLYG